MIVVVALNPALDVTYEVDRLQVGATNRAREAGVRAGGKPLNVTRILGMLGVEVTVVGLGGDPLQARFAEETAGLPISAVWVEPDPAGLTSPAGPDGSARTGTAIRRTIAVVDRSSGEVTMVNEPGPVLGAEAWERLRDALSLLLPTAEALVLSGSVPPGLPLNAYATLIRDARAVGAWSALDTDDPWLGPALAAGPDLVKPNVEELERAGLGQVRDMGGAWRAAARLRDGGPEAVVVSMGAEGLVAAADGCWLARPPRVSGNPTGAGDATLAGLVAASVGGLAWPERLRQAAALGAAAAAEQVAGRLRMTTYRDLLAATQVHAAEC